MYLINVHTLELEEFVGEPPAYAILSHRWQTGEPTLRTFQENPNASLSGFVKVRQFCKLGREELSASYAWVDTCCINKESSAELSEAINSMYRWYENSTDCVIYLSDVEQNRAGDATSSKLRHSEWFTRGWTLQELLAPKSAYFYDCEWEFLGARDLVLKDVEAATGIPVHFIQQPQTASVAQRMSWASKRKTTRPEDIAYCLLGLFGIQMPLLYGENGANAFYRLQLEIIRQTDDETIFAWKFRSPASLELWEMKSGLLADSPAAFEFSSSYVIARNIPREPYSMTNKGLRIEFSCTEFLPNGPEGLLVWSVPLNCNGHGFPIAITLLGREDDGERFCRIWQPIRILNVTLPLGQEDAKKLQKKMMYIPQRDLQDPRREKYNGWWKGWVPPARRRCYRYNNSKDWFWLDKALEDKEALRNASALGEDDQRERERQS